MDMDDLAETMRKSQEIQASITRTIVASRLILEGVRPDLDGAGHIPLLRMAEGLVAAHRAAKIDNDGLTLDLIEDAMRHVGDRLARETGDGRAFARKRLAP